MRRFLPLLLLLIASTASAQTLWNGTAPCPVLPSFDGEVCWNPTTHLLQYSSGGAWVNQAGGSGGGGSPGGSAGNLQTNGGSNTFGAYAGTSVTNQAITALNANGVATGSTITSAFTDSSIAKTGSDINTSNQVTTTHLASPLPAAQGGTGVASPTAHGTLIGEGASAVTALTLSTDQILVGSTGVDPVAKAITNCGDSSHALAYTTGGGFACQAITATATAQGGTGALQYNSGGGAMAGVQITGLVKGNGTSAPTAAVSGTDYLPGTSGIAGNPLTANGTGGTTSVAKVIHAGTGTLAAALAACTANAPCHVIADPGVTYTLSSELDVANGNYPVTLEVDGAIINITNTSSGTVGIALGTNSKLICDTYLYGAGPAGSIIKETGANVLAAVANLGAVSGTPTDTHMDVEGCNIQGGGTNSKGVLWVSGVDGLGTITNNTIAACGASDCVRVDDGTTSGLTNAISFVSNWVAPGASPTGRGFYIVHAGGSGIEGVNWYGGAIVDETGTVPLAAVDAGAGTIRQIGFYGTYFELKGAFTGDGLYVNNVLGFDASNITFDHNSQTATPANCVHLAGSGLQRVDITGWMVGGTCTNSLQDDKNSQTFTTGAINYHYAGAGAFSVAGTPNFTAIGASTAPLFGSGAGSFTPGTVTGNTTKLATSTGTVTSGHLAKWDASGNVVDSANTGVTAGSYTSANLTVNAQGQITAASNGSGVSGFVNSPTVTSGAATLVAQCASAGCTDDNRIANGSNSGALTLTTPASGGMTDGEMIKVTVTTTGTAPSSIAWTMGSGVTSKSSVTGDSDGAPGSVGACGSPPATGTMTYWWWWHAPNLRLMLCVPDPPPATIPASLGGVFGQTFGLGFDFMGTPGGGNCSVAGTAGCVEATVLAYNINVPTNYATPTSSCKCLNGNPAETDAYTIKCNGVSKGTFSLSTSCVLTLPTQAAYSCTAGQVMEIDAPATVSGKDVLCTVAYTR